MERNVVRAAAVVTVIVDSVTDPSALLMHLAIIGGVAILFDSGEPLLKGLTKRWVKHKKGKNQLKLA